MRLGAALKINSPPLFSMMLNGPQSGFCHFFKSNSSATEDIREFKCKRLFRLFFSWLTSTSVKRLSWSDFPEADGSLLLLEQMAHRDGAISCDSMAGGNCDLPL